MTFELMKMLSYNLFLAKQALSHKQFFAKHACKHISTPMKCGNASIPILDLFFKDCKCLDLEAMKCCHIMNFLQNTTEI